jgi:hypothetical protein
MWSYPQVEHATIGSLHGGGAKRDSIRCQHGRIYPEIASAKEDYPFSHLQGRQLLHEPQRVRFLHAHLAGHINDPGVGDTNSTCIRQRRQIGDEQACRRVRRFCGEWHQETVFIIAMVDDDQGVSGTRQHQIDEPLKRAVGIDRAGWKSSWSHHLRRASTVKFLHDGGVAYWAYHHSCITSHLFPLIEGQLSSADQQTRI